MAEMLVESTKLDACLGAEADAIRAKTGGSADIPFDYANGKGFADAIAAISGKEALSWHQCPEAVRNYLANVDYTGVSYTQSSISEYAPTPSVIANTKPIGKTVDGVTYYNTIPNADTPFATVNKAGTLNPLDHVRWINSQTLNMRDLGGWACDGGTVRYGMLLRCGNLAAADEDLVINQLGIHTELDLSDDGTPAYGDRMRFVEGVGVYYNITATAAWRTNLRGILDTVKYGEPVVFHCAMGADRTGTLACVLEGLLGVSQSDIDKDYELTSFYSLRARNGNYQGGTSDWAHLIAQILSLSGDTFRDKCVTFVKSLGFTVTEINTFRHAMIDGDPEDITVPTYTVTNTLTGCTTSNAATSANEGSAYAATITANSGYTLTGATVSVTMGGVDITAQAYSSGVISIEAVTGNIVITIAAVEETPLKELFDPSAATLNQRFNSSGAYSAQNGNFCTDFIPVSGLDSTDPWRIHICDTTDATRFRAFAANESVAFFDANKTILSTNSGRLMVMVSAQNNSLMKHTDSSGGVYIDINKTGDGNQIPSSFFDLSQVAYIRICMAYSSGTAIPDTATLANVSITADNITDEGSSDPVNLFNSTDSDVTLGARINSSGNAVAYADGQLVTGFIPAAAGDVFRIETDKALNTNSYTGAMATYTSAKGWIWNSGYQGATLEDGGLTEIMTVLADNGGHDQTGTAYVRFCVAYTDINNIKIYKQ